MRYILASLAVGLILIAGLKWAVSAQCEPPNKEALGLAWLSMEALENAANHIERSGVDEHEETPAQIAENLRLRAAGIRVRLSELGDWKY